MIKKETTNFGMPWEKEYGYSQAVKVGDTIYISGQVSHDDRGKIVGSDMESQMRQSYLNVKKVLSSYGASMENIVDETLFVTDMETAFAAAIKCRHEAFSGNPLVASTIVQIQRLAYPGFLIEIKCTAKI